MAVMIKHIFVGLFLLLVFNLQHTECSAALSQRFDITAYRVEGNTLISKEKIDYLLAQYTGKDRGIETVREAVETLRKTYHESGYTAVIVILPEQELEKGLIQLKVIEPRIGKVKVEGNLFFSTANILAALPALAEGKELNTSRIAENLSLANKNAARKITLALQQGSNASEIDATVEVRDEKKWKTGIFIDNTGDRQTGYFRSGVLLQHADVFDRDHTLSLQYSTSPENPGRVGIYGFGYTIPFYSADSSLDIIAAYSDVDSGNISFASSAMQVSGRGTVLGVHYSRGLRSTGNYEHKLVLGLDYRSYRNHVTLEGADLDNEVTLHPASLTYTGILKGDRTVSGFHITLSHNLPGGWAGRDDKYAFEKTRMNAPVDYTVFRFGANFSYSFLSNWQVRAVVSGQYTDDQLVPGEQFGLGGANSARGFREREVANDRGWAGNLELYTPDLARLLQIGSFQCRALAFYDTGHVYRVKALPGETAGSGIASVGSGLRLTDGKYFSISTDYGFIINPSGEGRGRHGGRWHIAATYMY